MILVSNGLAVLKELGLGHALLAERSAVSHAMILTGKNKRLGEAAVAGGGFKSIFLKRASLVRIIWEGAERQEIKITRGKRLQHIEVTGQGVGVTFQDGTSGNLLIAISPSSGQGASMALENAAVLANACAMFLIWSRPLPPMSTCAGSAPPRCIKWV